MGYSIFDETMVDMAWPEIEKAADEGAIVILPTGVIEEHGPHMGLAVDIYAAYLVSKLARRRLESKGIRTLIAPPYYWGINTATGSFAGSFTVRKETLKAIIYDILASLNRWGLNNVFNINWHGEQGHNKAILEAVKEARADTGVRAYCVLSDSLAKRLGLKGTESYALIARTPVASQAHARYLEIHADVTETSLMMHYFPDQVNAELARALAPTNLTIEGLNVWRRGWSDARRVTPLGYFGDPASFCPEAGKQLVEGYAQAVADLIESFMKGDYKSPRIE